MRIAFTKKDSVGCISLMPGKGEADVEPASEALDRFLNDSDLKAAVIVIASAIEETSAEIDVLKRKLEAATIPTAAAISNNVDDPANRIASSCLFQFSASSKAIEEAIRSAETHLVSLTARRPSHVIRRVMTSINNAGTLPLEEALLVETKLFCALSRMNRESASKVEER
jgi:hypothetical protein